MEQRSDAELVAAALTGDRVVFASLVRRYQDYAYGTAIGMLSDFELARDVVQEAFLCAYRDLRKLRDAERFGGWLHGIVKNTARRALRELARVQALADELGPSSSAREAMPSPAQSAKEAEEHAMVRLALSRLGETSREAVSLFYVNGLSYADIAGYLGVTDTAVQGRLQRGRQQLRKELEMVAKTFKDHELPDDFSAEVAHLLDALAGGTGQGEETIGRLAEIGAPAVDPLCEALGDPRDVVRECAARSLCRIGDARALRPILQVLYANDWDIASTILHKGQVLSIPGMTDQLLRLVREGTPVEQCCAIAPLAHAKGDDRVFDCLYELFRDRQTHIAVRRSALPAMCDLRPGSAVDLITQALSDPSVRFPSVWPLLIALHRGYRLPIDVCLMNFGRDVSWASRLHAGWLVLAHGDGGRAVLERLLREGSPDERATAAVVLAPPGDTTVFEILRDELLSGHQERKWQGLVARVVANRYPRELTEWAEQAKPDPAGNPALGRALALVRLASGSASDEDLLQYGTPGMRAMMVRDLARQRGAGFIPELRALLHGGEPKKIARYAFRQLRRLRDAALPAAIEMLTSKHWGERKAALCLLRQWGKLTAAQQARGRNDPHPAVRHAADWHPGYHAAAKRNAKWRRRIERTTAR